MKLLFVRLSLSFLFTGMLFLAACSGDKARLDNARFEIEQGNIRSAKKLLSQIPAGSSHRPAADSILKTLENR